MAILLDTNVLVRFANRADILNRVTARAILELHQRGELLHITAQNLVEFRNVATRPASANGLGMTVTAADAQTASFETSFPLLPETPDIFPAWKALVSALGVIGKQVHDARLVAVCHAHRVTHLMTFNILHFAALAGFGPGIVVVDPATV